MTHQNDGLRLSLLCLSGTKSRQMISDMTFCLALFKFSRSFLWSLIHCSYFQITLFLKTYNILILYEAIEVESFSHQGWTVSFRLNHSPKFLFTLFLAFVGSFLSWHLNNLLNMVVVMYYLAFVLIALGASLGYLINNLPSIFPCNRTRISWSWDWPWHKLRQS